MDFIGSTFTTATLAWALAYAFQFLGLETAWVVCGVVALLFSAVAFTSLVVGALVWAVRHVRIVIV